MCKVLECTTYSSSVAAFQITCCCSFEATQFRGRIPASNARILTYICYTSIGPGDGELVAPES